MPAVITNMYIRKFYFRMLLWLPLLMASGCKVIKNYSPDKPFVYKTDIKLRTDMRTSEKTELISRMQNQLDDSLQVKWVRKGFKQILNKPAVFDSSYAVNSIGYLDDLLRAQGFMYGEIKWDSTLTQVEDQQRVTVNFDVVTGKVMRFDSIDFAFRDSLLQEIALKNREKSILKKGDTYSKEKISLELDRILNIYRNNGYLKINRDDIYAEVDTVVGALIDPGLDPFEQIRLLEEVQNRRNNPQIDVVFRQKGIENPEHLQQYHIRNVRIFPDRQLLGDSLPVYRDTIVRDGIQILRTRDLFKPSFLVRNNYIQPGALYKQEDVYRTNNIMGQMGAWQQVAVDLLPVDSLGIVDVNINMYPAKKQSLNIDLEASRNASDVVTTSNLLGLGLNFGLRDRNLARQSIQASTNLRFGIELGNKGQIIQTFQTSLGQNFTIPKFVAPFPIRGEKNLLSSRTILNANGSYTDRRAFYKVQALNASIGYDWTNKKNRNWIYSPLNIEFVRVFSTDSLQRLFDSIPNLRNSFNDGLIISQKLIVLSAWSRSNKVINLKIGLEESGGVFGNIKSWDLQARLSRYLKADIDFRYYINQSRSSWAFRFFAGMGQPYGKVVDTLGNITKENNLPFFKSYFAGGPSSMRAWQVRQLGPGSSRLFGSTNADRFADIQLETNAEFRFNLATIYGIRVKSALFTDIGNIWFRNNRGNPNLDPAVFRLSKLYKDLAVAGGTSLRFDFSYFLIRFDWAYKLKDPFYSNFNNGWFYNLRPGNGQFQLGINHPF